MTTERKLSKPEQARKENLEKLEIELAKEGYKRRNITLSIVTANTVGILLTLPFVVLLIYFYLRFNPISTWDLYNLGRLSMLGLALSFVEIVIHEMIHGLTWGIFAKNHFKSINFGVIWKMLTPYCTCSDPLKKYQYVIGALMPTIILGFIQGAIAVMTNNFMLLFAAAILITGGAGDFLIVLKLLTDKSDKNEIMYLDHPYELGLIAFEK